ADIGQGLALGADAVEDAALASEGVTPPGLVVTPDQRFVARLEKQHLDAMPAGAQPVERVPEMPEVLPLPHVHAEGDLANRTARLRAQLGEGGNQRRGQVVDAEVAHVLEAFDGVALARPGEAGDDDDPDAGTAGVRGAGNVAHVTGST